MKRRKDKALSPEPRAKIQDPPKSAGPAATAAMRL